MKKFVQIISALVIGVAIVACSTDNKIEKPGEDNPGENVNPTPDPTPEPQLTDYYQLVAAEKQDWSGDYLIAADKRDGTEIVFAAWQNHRYGQPAKGLNLKDLKDSKGRISADAVNPFKTVISRSGEIYSVNVPNVGYIGLEKRHNLTYITEVPEALRFHWTIAYDADYEVVSIRNAETEGRQLLWNDAPDCFWFGCYSSAHDDIKALNVYERVTESI